jgi:hypothetical protein
VGRGGFYHPDAGPVDIEELFMSCKPLTKKEWQAGIAETWSACVKSTYQDLIDAAVKAEREACAKVCDSLEEQCEKLLVPDEKWPTPSDCAHIIRARGNT